MRPDEKFEAGRAARELAVAIYCVSRDWPREERFGLTAQVRSAAISVGSNLCEGAARRGPREFRRFLDQALGSHAELEFQIALAEDLGYLADSAAAELRKLVGNCGRLLWGLYRAVARSADRA